MNMWTATAHISMAHRQQGSLECVWKGGGMHVLGLEERVCMQVF